MPQIFEITTADCQQKFTNAIREYVGPGKLYSYQSAADELGFERRTVEAYVLGESMPTLPKLIRLCIFLEAIFTDKILAMAGLGEVRRLGEAKSTDEFELNAKTVGLLSKISEAIKDGRVDYREKEEILKEAWRLYNTLGNYIYAVASPDGKSCARAR